MGARLCGARPFLSVARTSLGKTMATIVSNRDFTDRKVFYNTTTIKGDAVVKTLGRVRSVVFHPEAPICVGIMVHRPDAALMFHRADLFVALDRLWFEDKDIFVDSAKDSTGDDAAARLGLDLDACVIWSGLAVVTRDRERLGYVGQVNFDLETGAVQDVTVYTGAAKDAILGRFVIPANLIRGFAWGVGDVIVMSQNDTGEEDEGLRGGLVVAAEARELATSGGVADAAGRATAKATNEVRKVKVKVKPKIDEGVKKAGEATTKGLYVTGRQLGRSRSTFSAFKEEYKKGLKGE